jgi:beta-aspartyl-peptidase (threonine type)
MQHFITKTLGFLLPLVLTGFANTDANAQDEAASSPAKMRYAIVIHGGAGSSAKDFDQRAIDRRRASLANALQKGVGILDSGGSSLDAVEAVLLLLEDDPQFNAGKGAVFNAAGSHELDASIMNGKDKSCGAVAGVSIVKNPISLARLVMTETKHVLLAGQGAEEFARQQKVELVEPAYFDTPSAKKSWEKYKLRMSGTGRLNPNRNLKFEIEPNWNIGTVGCVALDADGNIAAGTTTGGMTYKKFGRVGDSPIVGAGTYADNETCGVSATGIGEQYIRNAVAYDVSAQLKYKKVTLQEAVNDNLNRRLNKNDGGLIAIDKDGNIAMGYNTGGMARAAADSSGRFDVIWGEPAKTKE